MWLWGCVCLLNEPNLPLQGSSGSMPQEKGVGGTRALAHSIYIFIMFVYIYICMYVYICSIYCYTNLILKSWCIQGSNCLQSWLQLKNLQFNVNTESIRKEVYWIDPSPKNYVVNIQLFEPEHMAYGHMFIATICSGSDYDIPCTLRTKPPRPAKPLAWLAQAKLSLKQKTIESDSAGWCVLTVPS